MGSLLDFEECIKDSPEFRYIYNMLITTTCFINRKTNGCRCEPLELDI